MKKLKKKLTVWIVLTIMMFSVVPANYGSAYNNSSITVNAATKNYMKKLGVKFDLKKNKNVTIKTLYVEIGKKKQNVKITNYKIKNAKKKGYKELTFKVSFKNKWKPTKKEIHKVVQSDYFKHFNSMAGCFYITAMDYNTGMCLEEKNKQDVTVKTGSWKEQNRKTYKDNDGCYMWLSEKELDVTITYPKNYKGLCIAVGGFGTYVSTDNDNAYWNGEIPFGKSDYYKKNKSSVHVMRVTK